MIRQKHIGVCLVLKMNKDFTHLHVHSEAGSLLDGAIRVSELPKIAKQYGMSSIALSDHGSLAGSLEFYRECKKEKIKPILGIETYLTNDKDGLSNEEKTRDNYHTILIAATNEGWQNLLYLNSNAYKNNFYYKPRIWIEQLKDHSKGLIATSACLASMVSHYATYDEINNIYSDPEHKAEKIILSFKEMFFGNFYLEMMQSSTPQQIAYNKFLVEFGKKLGIKNIITADAHYEKKSDESLHELLMAMQSKQTIDEYKTEGYFQYENCYIRSPEEMLLAAKVVGQEEAFHNTLEISDKCNVDIELGKYKLPLYQVESDPDWKEYVNEH